ncbi:MAG: SCO family protein [Planctomycetia bacterium]|nr:SCO family protein [Planctomycetia bacterium]
MTFAVKIWLSLLLVLLAAYAAFSGWRIYDRTATALVAAPSPAEVPSNVIESTRPTGSLADLKLVDTKNEPFDFGSLKGNVWLGSFFFSSCPGPCAQMNRAIAALQEEINSDDLKFVSITVDPANDTPEHLAAYAHSFKADPARWFFLSGPFADVQHLGAEIFQVAVGPKMHTERVMLVDRASKLRGLYLTSDPTQTLALKRKIKELLAESPRAGEDAASERVAESSAAAKAEVADDSPAKAADGSAAEPSSEAQP